MSETNVMRRQALVLLAGLALGTPADAETVRWANREPWDWISPKTTVPGAADVGPVRMIGPRGGIASGQVVLVAEAPLGKVAATAGDLAGPGGATIPAAALTVRYGKVGGEYVPLLDTPPEDAATLPVWVTVTIPSSAAPGRYSGALEIVAGRTRKRVPLELQVSPFDVGPPRSWTTWVNLLQSPESVAGLYGVPRWSDRHFALMEKSFALMARGGNDVLGVLAVGQTVFGDDPLVLFRREGGRFVPELSYLERYLRLYGRHCGPPRILALHVWSYGFYERGYGRDGGRAEKRADVIPVVEACGGRLVPVEMPIFGRPGTEETWRAVIEGVRAVLARLGWSETKLLLGAGGDTWPAPETVAFFQAIDPALQWRVLTHGCGCPKWGPTPLERTQPNGMVVGYLEIARRVGSKRQRVPGHPVVCNSRDKVGANPRTYLSLPAVTGATGYEGICWKGIDYWTYTNEAGEKLRPLNHYVHFGNMVGSTPRAMAAAAAEGAVATVQYEMLIEGLQALEALYAVRDGLDRLYPSVTETYDVVQLLLEGALVRPDRVEEGRTGRHGLDLTIYFHQGKLKPGVLPKATTYNTARHAGAATELAEGRYRVEVTINKDPWVAGGTGVYTVDLQREGDRFTGAYRGAYNGTDVAGNVVGTFVPDGYTTAVGEVRPKDARFERWSSAAESAVKDLAAGKGDLRAALETLYRVAGEVDDALNKDMGIP